MFVARKVTIFFEIADLQGYENDCKKNPLATIKLKMGFLYRYVYLLRFSGFAFGRIGETKPCQPETNAGARYKTSQTTSDRLTESPC